MVISCILAERGDHRCRDQAGDIATEAGDLLDARS